MEFVIVGWRPKSKEALALMSKEDKEKKGALTKEHFDVHIYVPDTAERFTVARISGVPKIEPFLLNFKDIQKIVAAHAVMVEV